MSSVPSQYWKLLSPLRKPHPLSVRTINEPHFSWPPFSLNGSQQCAVAPHLKTCRLADLDASVGSASLRDNSILFHRYSILIPCTFFGATTDTVNQKDLADFRHANYHCYHGEPIQHVPGRDRHHWDQTDVPPISRDHAYHGYCHQKDLADLAVKPGPPWVSDATGPVSGHGESVRHQGIPAREPAGISGQVYVGG
ncbi:hypothetical protein B0H11DRAFT_2203772 [Mycena galericulata]|nr:hypothetical protein B0H11DRAFT_2203772 [Mycena galericulata]